MKKIVGAAIGNCVHVLGLKNFLKLADEQGYATVFLGPAVPIEELIDAVIEHRPDIAAVSYRLTPEVARNLFAELKKNIEKFNLRSIKYVFGGTSAVANVARDTGIFDVAFSGLESTDEVISYLRREEFEEVKKHYPQTLIERIREKSPYPLIRHHFGLPSLSDTIDGAKEIAMARVLDILSIGPDQNAQECFFRPKEMDLKLDGAGGVPIRKEEDLIAIYRNTRCGNFPLIRCYSGTQDLIKWAEMSLRTINNTWAAIPLCWYNQLDGRSSRKPMDSIRENQKAIRWHAEKKIPVEVNESHQWALRECGDVIEVATAYLAAYNAKELGVKDYVSQYMFNVPSSISPAMDLAKMSAKRELIESLHDHDFTSYRMVRTGLASLSSDFDIAKGQLASSIQISMEIEPHIVHVVGYSEGDHAATPKEIIESCKIAMGAIQNSMLGLPDMTNNTKIKKRKDELVKEAKVLLDAIEEMADDDIRDSLIDPKTIAQSIKLGLLDAPHLKGSKFAKGEIVTRMIDGACRAVHPEIERILSERERIELLNIN